jgi:hypothetical protein
MSTTDPKSPDYPPPGQPLTPIQQAANISVLKRNLAIGLLIACPILIALPPRKLDIYTFALGTTTFISLNHLQKHTTGRSFLNRIGINDHAISSSNADDDSAKKKAAAVNTWDGMPTEKARRYQQLMRDKKEAEAVGRPWVLRPLEEVKPVERKGVLESVWMGDEGSDWKQKREQKELEAMERGEGVGTLIQDYFAEAFGWKKDGEEEESHDKKS